MDNCKDLRKLVNKEDVTESYEKVNKYIGDIINKRENKDEAIKEIKSIICQFEGILNKANSYAVLAVSFALLTSVFAIASIILQIGNSSVEDTKILLGLLLAIAIISVFVVVWIGIGIKRDDYKDAFILKALNFKLDELNKNSESNKENDTTNESDIRNEENTANDPDETRDYREYVVRVYNK